MGSGEQHPDHVRPIGGSIEDTDFETAGQRAAAEEILKFWEATHSFAEIARRTSWSPSHIRNVFHEYFEAAEEPHQLESESVDVGTSSWEEAFRQGYQQGYSDGYSDGRADASE